MDLRGADLRGAHLEGADLREAHLEGADLRGAIGLTQEQLAHAFCDMTAALRNRRTHPYYEKRGEGVGE
jgi:uncharacterized protein YjbI with pentapeptide repeats